MLISSTHPIPPYMLATIEVNYVTWQLQDVSVDNNETRHQHPAEISEKEDADEATKEGRGSTEEKGNEVGN